MKAKRHGELPTRSIATAVTSTLLPPSNAQKSTLSATAATSNRCDDCHVTFDDKFAWEQHNKTTHSFDCSQCDAHFKSLL
jgi:protein-arginine kinase activator protein McsA